VANLLQSQPDESRPRAESSTKQQRALERAGQPAKKRKQGSHSTGEVQGSTSSRRAQLLEEILAISLDEQRKARSAAAQPSPLDDSLGRFVNSAISQMDPDVAANVTARLLKSVSEGYAEMAERRRKLNSTFLSTASVAQLIQSCFSYY
jgi:hypothetical protein